MYGCCLLVNFITIITPGGIYLGPLNISIFSVVIKGTTVIDLPRDYR